MAKNRNVRVVRTEKTVTITMPVKAAERLGVLLADTGDWIGNADLEDMDMTARQFEAAERDFNSLLDALQVNSELL